MLPRLLSLLMPTSDPPGRRRTYSLPLLGLVLIAALTLAWPGQAALHDTYHDDLIRVCVGWNSAMGALTESGDTTLLEPRVIWDADEICAGVGEPDPIEEMEDPLSLPEALAT